MDVAQLFVVPVCGRARSAIRTGVPRIAGAVRFVVLRSVGAVVAIGGSPPFRRFARFRLVLETNEVGQVVRDFLEVLLLGRMVDLVFDAEMNGILLITSCILYASTVRERTGCTDRQPA